MNRLLDRVYGTLDSLREDIRLGGPGPCLVVGSAPTAERPAGYDPSWKLICVNGSPAVASRLGLSVPDLVFMRELFGEQVVDLETQKALAGQYAKIVLYRAQDTAKTATEDRLHAIDFKFERIRRLTENERTRVIHKALGPITAFRLGQKDISTGLLSVMLAAAIGKTPIVLTGISLVTQGHFYSPSNLTRRHVTKDGIALRTMARRGVPLFTTDPVLAKDVGIPVWQAGAAPVSH